MKQVTLIGLGLGNPATLTLGALEALQEAELIVGAERLLQELPAACTSRRLAVTRAEEIEAILAAQADWQRVCLVLSGDLGLFSGAKKLLPLLAGYRVRSIAGVSSAQYLAAQLGRPWQDWRFASAHGLDCDLPALLHSGNGPLFLVTGGANTVSALCGALCAAGLDETGVTVGERLSYPDERIVSGTAEALVAEQFDPLSVLLVEQAAPAFWPYANSGLPDRLFLRGKVPMTKQEVRAVALSKLRIRETDTVYDIGAGSGSVAVELALLAKRGRVYAVEQQAEALALIESNRQQFGLANLTVVPGTAPAALAGLPRPEAAFIGGSGGQLAGIVAALLAANPQVRLCVACITLETLTEATQLLGGAGLQGLEVCQVAVSRAQALGRYQMLAAQNPVFLLSAEGVG